MTNIVRRDSFPSFSHLREELDRLFEENFIRWPFVGFGDEGTIALDISEREGAIIVRASLPGFDRDEIDVRLEDGVLSISATHSDEEETKGERYYRHERRYNALARSVVLPRVPGDAEVDAELKDGVLTLTIPLPEHASPKQIEIKAG